MKVANEVTIPTGHATLVEALLGNNPLLIDVCNNGVEEKKLSSNEVLSHKVTLVCNSSQNYKPYSRSIELSDIQVSDNLTKVQQLELLQLLNNYRMCFA